MAISCKSLCFIVLIAISGSIISDARESVLFGKAAPQQFDKEKSLFSVSSAIEKANKFGIDPNNSPKHDDQATLYSERIDEEEADEEDEEDDDVPDQKLKSSSAGKSLESNNFDFDDKEDKESDKSYPYGIGDDHSFNEDDQKQVNENPYYQYEGAKKHSSFREYRNYDNNNYRGYSRRSDWNNQNAVRKQGMSDTRYLENGKYYPNHVDLTHQGDNDMHNSYQTQFSDSNKNGNSFSAYNDNNKGNRFESYNELENSDDNF